MFLCIPINSTYIDCISYNNMKDWPILLHEQKQLFNIEKILAQIFVQDTFNTNTKTTHLSSRIVQDIRLMRILFTIITN